MPNTPPYGYEESQDIPYNIDEEKTKQEHDKQFSDYLLSLHKAELERCKDINYWMKRYYKCI